MSIWMSSPGARARTGAPAWLWPETLVGGGRAVDIQLDDASFLGSSKIEKRRLRKPNEGAARIG